MSRFQFYRSSGNISQLIVGGLVLIALFIGMFWVARSIFTILSYIAPFMLIAAAIINYRVVTGYGLWLWNTLKRDPIMGVVYTALSFFGFPILSAYLLFKAFAVKRVEKITKQHQQSFQGMYTGDSTEDAEFEILEERPLELNPEEDLRRYERIFDSEK